MKSALSLAGTLALLTIQIAAFGLYLAAFCVALFLIF